ncbi:MAG TPA: hypothetical protein VIJ55_03765 [Acetobacteraceae bacterium]
MSEPDMMTEEHARRLGALRVIEITELLMLVGRAAELARWARTELTVERVRQRLLDDMAPVRVSGAPPAPVMSAVEAAFAQRGLRVVR